MSVYAMHSSVWSGPVDRCSFAILGIIWDYWQLMKRPHSYRKAYNEGALCSNYFAFLKCIHLTHTQKSKQQQLQQRQSKRKMINMRRKQCYAQRKIFTRATDPY